MDKGRLLHDLHSHLGTFLHFDFQIKGSLWITEFELETLSPHFGLFFPSKGTFHIRDVTEFACLNWNGNLHQEGENKET